MMMGMKAKGAAKGLSLFRAFLQRPAVVGSC